MEATIDQLKYPVGKFSFPAEYSNADVERWIKGIESMPAELNKVWSAFSEEKKKMSYREGGWNAAQIVHHMADSHLNAYCRIKLALTE